tara:strand:+ start:12634 stop:13053 length:420 start_codon:yes stop_codon:yes gene_type:complete
LERQGLKVCVSDRWTFEFCLARYGLLAECCLALGIEAIEGTEDEKATYIQGKANKTDFAYDLADTLRSQLHAKVAEAIGAVEAEDGQQGVTPEETRARAETEYAASLRSLLPPYIVDAIEFVTAPIVGGEQGEANAGPA